MPLVVCPTPIGNLDDVSLRLLRELAGADTVLCEDTRRTSTLLRRHGISARLERFDAHVEARRLDGVLARLEGGERLALVSDAGLPAVSDPGARLVRAALDRGIQVVVLPGPSAVETALVASGLVEERYLFVGFVPRDERGRALLWQELARWPAPAVAFEAPSRLPETLASLARVDSERQVAVCRELTKLYEQVTRGTAGELAERFQEAPRGEVTLVLGSPGAERDGEDERHADAVAAVVELVAAGVPRRQASNLVARLAGLSRNRLYRDTLSLQSPS